MQPLKFSGAQLKTQMIKNDKSLKESAKELEITIEELQSYFEYEVIEDDMLFDILGKLKMWLIIEDPYGITSLAFKQFGIYEERIKLLEIIINGLMDYVNQTKNIAEECNNGTRKMLKQIQSLQEMLKIQKPELFQKEYLIDFNKMNENLKKCDVKLKESFDAFNEHFKVFKK